MYIKLNTIRVQYLKEVNDNYILSEVPDSTMSYEKPILVRTVDELISWFGYKFSSYNYFVELINQGVSLYIYRPVRAETIETEDYINLDEYDIDPDLYPTKEYLEIHATPYEGVKYWVGGRYIDWDELSVDPNLDRDYFPEEPSENTKYLINGSWYTYTDGTWYSEDDTKGEFYIYYQNSWIPINDLPQISEKTSISQENRDTLLIAKSDYENTITYCNPEYHESRLGIFSTEDPRVVEVDDNYPITIEDTTLKSTYVFDMDTTGTYYWINTEEEYQNPDQNIILPDTYQTQEDAENGIKDWVNQNLPDTSEITLKIIATYLVEEEEQVLSQYYISDLYLSSKGYLILPSTWIVPDIEWEHLDEDSGSWTTFPDNPEIGKKYRINLEYWTYYDFGNEQLRWISKKDKIGKTVNYLFYYDSGIEDPSIDDMILESYIASPRRVEFSFDPEEQLSKRDQLISGLTSFAEEKLEYTIINIPDNPIYSLYSPRPVPVENCYDIPGFSLEPDEKKSQILLTLCLDESDWGIEVWSKTIGRSDPEFEEDLIELQIDEISNKEIYQITVSRFGRSEVYEGTIKPKTGEEERLDYIISRESKLIYIRFDNISSGLRTGKWKLRGAIAEEYNPTMYWKALEIMFNSDSVIPDYLLIPDKTFWTDDIRNKDYLIKFLNYAKAFSFQVLIQNDGSKYSIVEVEKKPEWNESIPSYILFKTKTPLKYWYNNGEDIVEFNNTLDIEIAENKGDFIYNYTKDPDNRLVYFFLGMTVQRRYRPAYYMYLLGWLRDIYSMSAKYINYSSFVTNPYIDEEFEKQLMRYKSNYLICNNQLYYYKGYQNGETYNSTGWMRFSIGRISRDLQRFRWRYLGKRSDIKTRETITDILNDIVSRFSIIGEINITSFVVNSVYNLIYLRIETKVKDLIDNNISLDITINYKEN